MFKWLTAIGMAILMTNIPHLAWAEAAKAEPQMIPTSMIVENMTRDQAIAKIQTHLSNTEIRSELLNRGVAPEEVSARLASLSNQELQQLAMQMDEARYGGDPAGILLIVALVLLIIFLAKRI